MSIFTKVGEWFAKEFSSTVQDADKIAIAITEATKQALNDGVLNFVAEIVDGLTKSGVAEEIVTLVSAHIYQVLAVELAIQGLPANPTPADILTFEQAVLKAFGVTSDKSKLYTQLAAQIYGLIQAQVNAHLSFTFADLVKAVEAAYQDYLQDQQAQAA
jgi:hypothetical protein